MKAPKQVPPISLRLTQHTLGYLEWLAGALNAPKAVVIRMCIKEVHDRVRKEQDDARGRTGGPDRPGPG